MSVFHIVILCLFCFVSCCFAEDKAADGETWDWMPAWRDSADCGLNVLYVLMNLEGHKVNISSND